MLYLKNENKRVFSELMVVRQLHPGLGGQFISMPVGNAIGIVQPLPTSQGRRLASITCNRGVAARFTFDSLQSLFRNNGCH